MNNTKNLSATFVSIKKTYILIDANKNEFTDFFPRNAYNSIENKISKKNIIMTDVLTNKKLFISQLKISQNDYKNKFIYTSKSINFIITSIFEKVLQNEIKMNFENILNIYS